MTNDPDSDPDSVRLDVGAGAGACVGAQKSVTLRGAAAKLVTMLTGGRWTVNAASDVILARRAKGSTPSCGHEVR